MSLLNKEYYNNIHYVYQTTRNEQIFILFINDWRIENSVPTAQ